MALVAQVNRETPPPPKAPKGASERNLSSGLRRSLIVHAALFAIILIKSLVFPGTPTPYIPALRVDIVGLPDLTPSELARLPKTLPPTEAETAAEKLAEKAEEAPPVETSDEAEPDEMVLEPKKGKKADKNKDRKSKIETALAKMKALQKIRSELDSKPQKESGALIKGNQISRGSSLTGEARESAQAHYYDLIRDRLQENWEVPVWIARQKYSARVVIHIDAFGRLRSYQLLKPSGNAQFDEAVKRSITEGHPYPAPPEGIASSVLTDGILVGFPL